jgi:hypothetical protein
MYSSALLLALFVGGVLSIVEDALNILGPAIKQKIDDAYIITMCEVANDEIGMFEVDAFVSDIAFKDSDNNRPYYKAKHKVRSMNKCYMRNENVPSYGKNMDSLFFQTVSEHTDKDITLEFSNGLC